MLRVIVIGMGPIGVNCAKQILADTDLQLVGLVDLDPAKVGKTADELDGLGHGAGPKVTANIPDAPADVAIVTTTSKFDRVVPIAGAHVQRERPAAPISLQNVRAQLFG